MRSRLEIAKDVFEIEAQSIKALEGRIDKGFDKAIDLLMATKGKIVVSGMGKSGIIGRKFVATLSSTGSPALFLHPAEGSHGDLGVISKEDTVIVITYGGGSSELDPLFSFVKRKGIKLIGITGNLESSLAQISDAVIDISVEKEACPLSLAPTSSSTATLAMCDAVAMVLLEEKGFKKEDFAQVHPGGALGRKLLTRVKDLLREGESMPVVFVDDSAQKAMEVMTAREVKGVCGVLNSDKSLVGVITDGDVRRWLSRALKEDAGVKNLTAKDLMSHNPKTIDETELAQKALYLMEEFSISSLIVMSAFEGVSKPVGILHIQDLLDAKIA